MRTKTQNSNRSKGTELTLEQFDAMSPAEKEAVYAEVDRPIPRSQLRPLTAAERARWARFKKRLGRPKIGLGAKPVTVSIERGRLERIDAFLKRHGLARSAFFLRGAELAMAEVERKSRRKRA